MEAHNKPLKNWLHDVEIGTIRLPRFQRKESWKPNLIKKFLQAVISEHPLGVLLLLEVNSSDEPFVTRKIEGSEESENCRMHLLDGQQRLTALFRALKNNYSDRIYFVRFSKQEDGTCEFEDVIDRSKKSASNLLDPAKEYDKGWIPVSILEPGETGRISANRWKNAISDSKKWDGSAKEKEELEVFLDKMRDRFNSTNIPSLIIPQGTDPSLAIEIFISINTSSVKLSHFDIANAQCEQREAKSLHDMVSEVENRIPKLVAFEGRNSLGDMLLKIACMDQGLQPQMGNYKKLDFRKVHGRLKTYIAGLIWTLGFLEAEEIWDSRWVPSKVPFRVLPLLLSLYTQCKRTNKDKAEKLIRGYCWRTFLTERYTRQVNDRLYDDYLELRSRLEKKTLALESTKDTIFDAHRYKVPRVDDIKDETWPTKKSNLSKAMLAIFVKKGAKGIETGKRLTHSTIQSRDYHHIFPIKLLGDKEAASHAINCMLLEPEANRSWNKKWPGEYLTRLEVNRSDLIDRLSSHTLPEAFLIDAKKEKEKRELKKQYEEFCNLRAALVIAAMNKLYKGEEYR